MHMKYFSLATAIALAFPLTASAAITLIADPADYGSSPAVFTANPETNTPAARGITGTRQLRQTFQFGSTLTITSMVLSLNLTLGSTGGLDIEIFEVANVNASPMVAGGAVHSFSIPAGTALPGSAQRVQFDFTGTDVFTLNQRNTGTEGYVIQISNGDGVTTIGNLRHTNAATDVFASGKFFLETGAQSGTGIRDAGLSLTGVVPVPEPSSALLGVAALVGLTRRRRA